MNAKTVVVVAGPTASGKTALAIELAQYFGTEIISADARQCYRQMNIGTAKPTSVELEMVPHHLVGHKDVWESYSAGQFACEALKVLEHIFAKHSVAIVVGGSGLYLRALCRGIDEMPPVNEALRQHVNALWQERGLAFLLKELQQYDPTYYHQVDKSNPARVKRALEVIYATGKPYSSFRKQEPFPRPFRSLWIGLHLPRQVLYQRIHQRVEHMMAQGLLKEVESLLPYRHYHPLKTVGYSELFSYLDGLITLDQAVDLIKQHTRNYAKRQLTWFSREPIQWFAPDKVQDIFAYLEQKI
ncbi:MAG: tRNA (adenosine(37)-N6)-dimethylallyltransferase MiaA [Cytophagales bacterium]|nr:tRNA (adenosine(37)-N6)-dimethylallyltransferase MiaA [Bernardetiaceae bacterium]MDW8210305.1 tRNA (adenosine(37)-N6)-dimethylallyltransferase MiaA [Cytophagales bacterium]